MDDNKKTWKTLRDAVLSGILPDHDGCLLPGDTPLPDKIILLELARETAIASGLDLANLENRKDFAEWVGERRPDPTRDEWLWLYSKIGVRHPILSVDEVVGIMAGRDALLPFLRSAPDLRLVECYEKFFEEDGEDEPIDELPYPQLEEAVKNDVPAKLGIYRLLCRNITDNQILARSISLEKPAVTCSLLKKLPPMPRIQKLIMILRRWDKPEELLVKAVESFGPDIASWHDDYGNGFFWYLYARNQPVSKAMIDTLPDEVIASWEQPNRFGIAASDLWPYYRKTPDLYRIRDPPNVC